MKNAKKWIGMLLCVLMALSCLPVFASAITKAAEEVTHGSGDVNADGMILSDDARLAYRYAVGKEHLGNLATVAADVNWDGKVTTSDARLILRDSAYLENYLTAKRMDSDYFAKLPISETAGITLETDWYIFADLLTVEVYLDAHADLESWGLIFTYDKNTFGITEKPKISIETSHSLVPETNTQTDGIIYHSGFSGDALSGSTQPILLMTIYLTVEDASAFAKNEQVITAEGFFDFGTEGKVSVSDSITKDVKPAEPSVVLATDWEVDENNEIALDIFFDDAINMTSSDFRINYDRDIFGVSYAVAGKDAKKCYLDYLYQYEYHPAKDGLVRWSASFKEELLSSKKWASYGLDVNGEHFHALTIYLTVEDADAFENETTVIDIEGSYSFANQQTSISVYDSIEKTGGGHVWGNGVVTTEPTHTADGERTYTCSHCGETKIETVPAIGHSYSAVVTAPTCTEQGYTTYTCSCGDTYKYNYTNASGHTKQTMPAVDPTCSETGLTEGTKCANCGEIIVEQTVVDKLEHTDSDNDNKCDECGTKVNNCDCICHSTNGFFRFFYKLIQFFRNLFGIYSECKCGVVHK